MAQRVREHGELAPAERFLVRLGAALQANEPAQAWRIPVDRTLRASLTRFRPAAPAGPTQSAPSAVIAWAGQRPWTLANRYQFTAPLPMPCPRSQRCPSRHRRNR